MLARRLAVAVLLPWAVYGVAREMDAALGVLLYTSLDVPGLAGRVVSVLDPGRLAATVLASAFLGTLAWAALSAVRARAQGLSFAEAGGVEAAGFEPLYLRPVVTLLALAAVAARPTFPYGLTLPVALTQDWSVALDVAAVAALVAIRWRPVRLPAPGAGAVFFMAFLAYAVMTPERAREWDGHPGNEPKYLRMGVAIGHALTLDVEGVSGPMEELTPRPLGEALAGGVRSLAGHGWQMARALIFGGEGGSVFSPASVQATRITRQTIRGKEGGVYHVLAPGPSVLLAPTLRVDRALNRDHGTPGRLAVTVLAWNALGAALVMAVFLLARDAGVGAGLAAGAAIAFAALPPALFYAYQFYPEMPGALVFALSLRLLLFHRRWTAGTALALGLLLATLPWLHQKFLPLWAVLVAMAVVEAVQQMVTARALAALLVPQLVGLVMTGLYNFAITGSVRPDALFLAWGPRGVASARVGQGLLGLLLDARFGLLPQVPLYLLAAAGAWWAVRSRSRLARALVPAAVYYLTVAAADNWSGAVCNLGRYVMPVLPLAAVLAAAVLVAPRRARVAVALAFAGWSALIALALWRDPLAANDGAVLFAKSAFADPNVYVPNLFLRSFAEGAPGLGARLLVWCALLASVAVFAGGDRALRAMATIVAVGLVAAAVLERWPSPYGSPRFPDAVELASGTTAFVSGARAHDNLAETDPGSLEILVRSRRPLTAVVVSGPPFVRLQGPGAPPAGSTVVTVPLDPILTLVGRRGLEETLYRQRLRLDAPGPVPLGIALPAGDGGEQPREGSR